MCTSLLRVAGVEGNRIFFSLLPGMKITRTAHPALELQTKVPEDYAKFYNHGEGPYQGLLLVESAYSY